MNNIPSITYIKGEKEKTFSINNKLMEKLIFFRLTETENINIPSKEVKTSSYKLLLGVTFIHIKNYTFKESIQFLVDIFSSNAETTIILENCTFCNDLFFRQIKNIKIINPKFQKSSNIYIVGDNGERYSNIEIDLTNSTGELNLEIENCNELNLISSESLKKLGLAYINDIIIENMNNTIVETLYDIKNLNLKNSIITKFIPNRNRSAVPFKYFSSEHFDITNLINLENSTLVLPRDFEVTDDFDIILKNSSITSNYSIKIPNVNFIKIDDELEEDTILDNTSYIQAKEIIINNQIYQNNILTQKEKKELIPTITYKKNNKEITFDFEYKYLNDMDEYSKMPIGYIKKQSMKLDKNIELIHLKNITFKNITFIDLYHNQTLTLENCTFSNSKYIIYTLYLNRGNIKIINPSFETSGTISVSNAHNLCIDFTIESIIGDDIYIKTDNIKNCVINYHDNLKNLDIDAKHIYLKNFNSLENIELNTKELILKDTILPKGFTKNHPKTKVRKK